MTDSDYAASACVWILGHEAHDEKFAIL